MQLRQPYLWVKVTINILRTVLKLLRAQIPSLVQSTHFPTPVGVAISLVGVVRSVWCGGELWDMDEA